MNCDTCGVTFLKWNDLRQHAALEKHGNRVTHDFSCLSCALPLQSIADVIQHIDTEEHYILSLASDNSFDRPSGGLDGEPFPPLYICLLCSCRDGNPYGIHLKSAVHKNIARLMRAMYDGNTIHYTNDACDEDLFTTLKDPAGPVYCELCNSWSSNWYNYKGHLKNSIHVKTQEFMNKLINVKQYLDDDHACDDICYSFPFACELCNLHFSSHEYYKHHLEDQTHKRVELFLMKMSELVRRMDVIIRCAKADLKVTETFSNSLPPLYYCELCDLFCFKAVGYVNHSKGNIHRRIEELFSKLSDKRKGKVIRLNLEAHGFKNKLKTQQHYCKLCIFVYPDAQTYGSHLKGKEHLRIEHFVKCLTNAGDANFMNTYIDAQLDMMFGNTPPNYCKVCNILHSKPVKYMQHLESEEHKQAEQSYQKNNKAIENPPKKLKVSHPSPLEKSLDNIQCSSAVSNNSLADGQNKPSMSGTAPDDHGKNSSYPPCPEFARHQVHSHPPRPEFGIRSTFEQPPPCLGFETRPTSDRPPPWSGFETRSSDGFPPPLIEFETRATNDHPPHWIRHQYHASYSNPWPGFETREPYGYPPHWPGIETREPYGYPPHFPGFETREPYGYPPHWPGIEHRELYGYPPQFPGFNPSVNHGSYPPWFGFEAGVTNDNYPPRPEFEAGLVNSGNPPWNDFPVYAHDINHPRFAGSEARGIGDIPPLALGFASCEPDSIRPPGTEVLENAGHCPPQHELENSSSHPVFEALEPSEDVSLDEHCCELCDFVCSNSRLYDKHLQSEKHKKLRKLLNRKGKKISFEAPPCETSAHHPMQYNCELCDVFNRNYQEYEFHLNGTKHKRNQWLLYVLMQRPL